MSAQLRVLAALYALTFGVCHAQTVIPASVPELRYPPLARAAHVQGDVVVSFRRTPEGRTVDVAPISGNRLLEATAVENVKSWQFEQTTEFAGQATKVIFRFRLNPPDDEYDDGQVGTKVALDGTGSVQVISILTMGLERSECPTAAERVPPAAVVAGDFVEVARWDEIVSVSVDGSVVWKQGNISQRGQIMPAEAKSLLDRFRAPAVWALCGRYDQAGLLDGGGSSFKVRIGGIEKSVGEYGDAAPAIFEEIELAVDTSADTHKWRHGEPKTESIAEITFESLPKPGKTKLMMRPVVATKRLFRRHWQQAISLLTLTQAAGRR